MSDGVRADPAALRYLAGRILGDREQQFRPRLTELREQLLDGATEIDVLADGRKSGYIYSRTPIGSYHDELCADLLIMFEDLDRGMLAVSNVLASVAEDFMSTDKESASRLNDATEYFKEGTNGRRPL